MFNILVFIEKKFRIDANFQMDYLTKGAKLVEIESSAENNFILPLTMELTRKLRYSIFIIMKIIETPEISFLSSIYISDEHLTNIFIPKQNII